MITFDKKTKIFHIKNSYFSYVFKANNVGVLEKLYYGNPIEDLDPNCYDLISDFRLEQYSYLDRKTTKEVFYEGSYFSTAFSYKEIPSFYKGDKREPLIEIEHADGSLVTDFRYYSHEIINKAKTIDKLPYFKDNKSKSETLCVTLKDIKSDIFLNVYYVVFEDSSALIKFNEITNKSNENVTLLKAGSLNLDLPSMDYKLTYIRGTYAADRLLEEIDIKHNKTVIDLNECGKAFYHNPVCMLSKKSSSDISGEAIGLGLVYSSQFSFVFQGTQLDQTRVYLGINNEGFAWNLKPNETFTTPQAFLVYSSKGSDEVTLQFHDLFRNHLIRDTSKFPKNTILLNSWEGMYFNFNTDKIIACLDKAKEMGVNLFVLDDGWFGKRDDDLSSLGDWEVNKNKIDLGKCINYAHSIGLKFGLWVEPEQISPDSNIYREHPEYALYDRDVDPTLFRHQLVMDLSNPKVIDYIDNCLDKIFNTYDIDYCKWDFNRYLSEAVSPYLDKVDQRGIYHRFILGTYELFNRFMTKHPNILLESCSGGGGRFDPAMLFYSSQIWASDETDGIVRTCIQYATNMFYPLSVIGSHVSARRYLSIKEKAAIAMFGTFGYELNPCNLTENDLKDIKECNQIFLDNKDIIDNGNYYGLISPFNESNFVSWQIAAKDKTKSIVFIMNYKLNAWRANYLKLKGLDSSKYYKCSADNKVYKGDVLMNIGLNFNDCRANNGSSLVSLVEVDG